MLDKLLCDREGAGGEGKRKNKKLKLFRMGGDEMYKWLVL